MTDRASDARVAELVKWLSDGYQQTWTRMISYEDAAHRVLAKMTELGIIDHAPHRYGGSVWFVGAERFGRVDKDAPTKPTTIRPHSEQGGEGE